MKTIITILSITACTLSANINTATANNSEIEVETVSRSSAPLSYSREFGGNTTGYGNQRIFNLVRAGKPFTTSDGLCFVTKVSGFFGGANENVHMRALEGTNQWQLLLTGHGLEGRARCILF